MIRRIGVIILLLILSFCPAMGQMRHLRALNMDFPSITLRN